MAQKVVQAELTFTPKSFNDKDGNSVDYVEIVAVIAGEKVRLKPHPGDKSLLSFLLSRVG